MPLERYTEHIYLWSIYLAVFCLPLYPGMVGGFIGLSILSGLLHGKYQGWDPLRDSPRWFKAAIILPIVFYGVHLIGMFWTEDLDRGQEDLVQKITLVLVPGYILAKGLDKKLVNRIFKIFKIAVLISILWNFGFALNDFLNNRDVASFQGHLLVRQMHLGYYTLYLLVALSIVLDQILLGNKKVGRGMAFSLIAILIICGTLVMTGSKMGFISLSFLILITAVIVLLKSKHWKKSLLFVLGSILVLFVLVDKTGYLVQRLENLTLERPLDVTSIESTMARRMAWDCSVDQIKKAPLLGAGTGDDKSGLLECYATKGYSGVLEKGLDQHSQYFRTGTSLGILAVITLIMMFLIPAVRSIQRLNLIGIYFFTAFLLAMVSESILEREMGMHLYTVMLPFVLYNLLHTKKKQAQ